MFFLHQSGRCYKAEICTILFPLRCAIAWYIVFLPKSKFSDSGQKPWTIIRRFDKISFALTFASGLLASNAYHSEFRGERVAEGNVSSEKGLSGGDYGSVEQRSSQSSSLQTLLVRFEIERDSVKLPFCRTCDDG